jgi:ribose/xylose/arabinose/galactoside ABC-type transport system permease subunit
VPDRDLRNRRTTRSSVIVVRRHVLLAVLIASLMSAAAFVLTNRTSSAHPAVPGVSEFSDQPSTASVVDSPLGAIAALVAERAERIGEVARSDGRQPTRHARSIDWALAMVVATAAIAALTIALARRRTGRTAVRAGRVAPARAPPLFLSHS